MRNFLKILFVCTIAALTAISVGCSSTESDWGSGKVVDDDDFGAPPPGLRLKRLAVLDFKDKSGDGERGAAAADQLITLLVNTERFEVVERTELERLLKEQDMEGIVDPDQLARPGVIKGVDLLCYGSITDFEIKKTKTGSGFGVGRTGFGVDVLSVDNKGAKLDFHVGVDLRIVDTSSGKIYISKSTDMRRTESADGMGLTIAGISYENDAEVEVDNENQGRLLRLALHDIVKKIVPKIDRQYSRGWK